MVHVKRNSREFKDIKEVFDDYAGSKTAKKLIKLYSVKAYESLDKKILLNDLKKDSDILFTLNYDAIMDYLRDRSRKLFRENEEALYYFKSSQGSEWIEFPFELTGKIKKKIFPLKIVR